MKKVLSLTLVALMLASLSACGEGTEKPKGESESTDPSSTPATEVVDGPSWKQDTAPTTLEWFVGYDWAANTFDAANNVTDQYISEETGVTIKWSYGDLEKLNMLITTNSLPDIITYDVVSSERLIMENNGLLQPMDDLMKQYAPDMKVPQEMMDWYRNEKDGHWYAFASYYGDTSEEYQYLTNNLFYARSDIMEQLDITKEEMQTKAGFIEALKKVKEAKIEYNGVTVEPFIGENVTFVAEQFGADREDAEGNMLNIMRQPEYLEALLFFSQLYNEGLMSDEVFTMDEALRRQKVASGAVFAGLDWTYLDGLEDLYHSDNNALMKYIGNIKGDAGKEAILSPSATGGWTGTMISKNCDAPERAIRLFSLLTQDEMNLAYNYGGVGGYEIVDGVAKIKPEILAERNADPAAYKEKYITDAEYFLNWDIVGAHEEKENLNTFQIDQVEVNAEFADSCYNDKPFFNTLPEGGSDLAAKSAQIDEYWKQQYPQIVMASDAEKVTEMYQQMLVKMDAMGMKELDDYKNERFQINKEKLGMTTAWPRNQK